MKKRIETPFSWYGGKSRMIDWLMPLLPKTPIYCEVFGGSGVVLFNRDPAPLDIYNDLNGEIAHFFKMLRENEDELIRRLYFTPFSRTGFIEAFDGEPRDEIDRARYFFIKACQSRNGAIANRSWGYAKKPRAFFYVRKVDKLPEYVERLRKVQLENDTFSKIIERYDSEDILFYCDPPYPHSSRSEGASYGQYEMSEDDHKVLAELLKNAKGKVALSGYHCPLYDDLYADWYVYENEETMLYAHAYEEIKMRQEVLWTNYEVQTELDIFTAVLGEDFRLDV